MKSKKKLRDFPKHYTENVVHFRSGYRNTFRVPSSRDLEIKPLYRLSYLDGPLSGVFEFDNKLFYSEPIYEEDRRWWVAWLMDEEDVKLATINHDFFVKYVGNHTSYQKNAEGRYVRGEFQHPREMMDGYYKTNLPKPNYEKYRDRDFIGILPNPF